MQVVKKLQAAVSDILTYPPERLADLTGVDVSTARRWKRAGKLPAPILRLLALCLLGRLDLLGWDGWTLLDGSLQSPEGWAFSPGEVLALPLLRLQLAQAQAEIRRFMGLEQQPKLSGEEIEDAIQGARSRGA
jgi:hypothetical protein